MERHNQHTFTCPNQCGLCLDETRALDVYEVVDVETEVGGGLNAAPTVIQIILHSCFAFQPWYVCMYVSRNDTPKQISLLTSQRALITVTDLEKFTAYSDKCQCAVLTEA